MGHFLHTLGLIAVLHILPAVCDDCAAGEIPVRRAAQKMEAVAELIFGANYGDILSDFAELERMLECSSFPGSKYSFTNSKLVAHLYKAPRNFRGLAISANATAVSAVDGEVKNKSVHTRLPPSLLRPEENTTIVFCMITAPEVFEPQNLTVLDGKVVGVSVRGKKLSGLTDRIHITFVLQEALPLQEGKEPRCHYLSFSSQRFHPDGCHTQWEPGDEQVVCSCDHLTYFAVLLVRPETSERDQNILTYISLIGCSISLFSLIGIFFLFVHISNRKMLADASLKIHLNLAVALILLNVHFLPSQQVALLSISGPCVYLAVMLHYSLLATFTWTAIEGFHLYLLLVRVFNIYIKKYLLKLGLVGWGYVIGQDPFWILGHCLETLLERNLMVDPGLPALVVAIILIIDRGIYKRVTLHPSDNSNVSNQICYLEDSNVQKFSIAFCGLVWSFGLIMLVLTCKVLLGLRRDRAPGGKNRTWKDVCTMLGISCLLGVTWGLVFLSFGTLPTPGLYLFCILNSLQGFFVSLWICISWRRACTLPRNDSQATKSTDLQNRSPGSWRPGNQETSEATKFPQSTSDPVPKSLSLPHESNAL